ncbi:MAG: type 4a pilus biogenesis protein PilO [Deltaproteobacteria bacterium]|jgi:Tfp pilus assembly protein PilO|nr:type 4a pilus biogenesis protein PilO [Deltaproteobacteria bacterium]
MAKAKAQKKQQSDFFVKIAKLSKGSRVGILLASIGAIVVGFYFLVYSPWQVEVTALEGEVKTLNETLTKEQTNLNKHKAINQYIIPTEITSDYLSHLFTNTDEIDGLLRIIAELGSQAGININTRGYLFRTKTVIGPQYAEVQFTVDLEASFLNFVRFLYSVSNYSRLINITSVSMGNPTVVDNRQVLLRIRCEGSAYRKLSAEEAKLATPAKKK